MIDHADRKSLEDLGLSYFDRSRIFAKALDFLCAVEDEAPANLCLSDLDYAVARLSRSAYVSVDRLTSLADAIDGRMLSETGMLMASALYEPLRRVSVDVQDGGDLLKDVRGIYIDNAQRSELSAMWRNPRHRKTLWRDLAFLSAVTYAQRNLADLRADARETPDGAQARSRTTPRPHIIARTARP